jgi:hypothetical protein
MQVASADAARIEIVPEGLSATIDPQIAPAADISGDPTTVAFAIDPELGLETARVKFVLADDGTTTNEWWIDSVFVGPADP